MAALINDMGSQRIKLSEEEKKMLETLKNMGEGEKVILKSLDEAQKFVPPMLRKFMVDNKMKIAKSFKTESAALKKECPKHPMWSKPSVEKAEKGIEGSLGAAIDALATVFLDIFLLVMGLIGFPSLKVPVKEFLKSLNKKKLAEFFVTETLLGRLKRIKKWNNDFSLFKELCLFIAEAKGFYSAFATVVDALYYAVTSDLFTLVQAILCLFAQMIVWTTTVGAQIIASIYLVASTGYDLIVHAIDAVNKWEAYLAKQKK